jgi:hypothetical protein
MMTNTCIVAAYFLLDHPFFMEVVLAGAKTLAF